MLFSRKSSLATLSVLLFISSIANQPVQADDGKTPDAHFAQVWVSLMDVAERILEHHLRPPVRQQMLADACRGLYKKANQNPPADLSEQFSETAELGELQSAFRAHWDSVLKKDSNLDELKTAAIEGLIAAADPGIQFVAAREFRVERQLAENRYVGIGIQLARTKDGYPRITKPFYGGAAQKAGARVGDLIVSVDGVNTHQRDFGEVIQDLRGAENTEVVVGLRHETEDVIREKKMIRTVVPIDSIVGRAQDDSSGKWDISIEGGSRIAHLRFQNIVGSTAAEMQKMARQIEQEGFEGVIYDFRNVRGAQLDLHHAVMLADVFTRGELAEVIERGRTKKIKAIQDSVLSDLPGLCLFNEQVAGPQFLVAAALSNLPNVKFMGRVIQSDGICRKSVELEQGGALNGISYAIAKPKLKQTKTDKVSELRHALQKTEDRGLIIRPEILADYSDQEGMTTAIREYFGLKAK